MSGKNKEWFGMGFFEKLKQSLVKTQEAFVGKIDQAFARFQKVDEDLFDELEEIMISADLGVSTTEFLLDNVRKRVKKEHIEDASDVKRILQEEMAAILKGEMIPLNIQAGRMNIILVVGVNGVGK